MHLAADWQMLGSFADWTTAGVALLAFIVAAVAAKFTAQTNRAQQETLELQRKQYEDSRRALWRAQAEKVSFWEVDNDIAVFLVLNASDSPIFAVDISLAPRPKLSLQTEVLVETPFVLPTGPEPIRLPNERYGEFSLDHVGDRLQMRFADTAGRFWIRNWDGEIKDFDRSVNAKRQ